MGPDNQNKRVAVVGVGDRLLADDGLGVHAVKKLERDGVPDYVVLIDTGDDAHRAARAITGCERVLLVDAVCCGLEPGCVHSLPACDLRRRGARLSNHGSSLLNMIKYEQLSGGSCKDVYVIGMEPATMHFGMGLSECCRLKMPELLRVVREKIASYAI